MDYVIEPQMHTVLADCLYQEMLSGRTNFFYFMGGVAGTDPALPVTSFKYEQATRNNMLSIKKIGIADASLVVPIISWTNGTTYDFYDDNYTVYPAHSGATSLQDAQFYVLTSDFNVYKCLNNKGNSPSTVMPTGTSTSTFMTSDGYIWKFMYNIPLSSINKFLNNNFMPVQVAVNEQFYSSGAVISTTINTPGTGYTVATVTITGDGTGATATLVITSGGISNVVITNQGHGYTYATANISGDGSGAAITVNLSVGDMTTTQSNVELLAVPGTIENIQPINGGVGYTTATVAITGDGTGATATANIVAGVITSITMVDVGEGYSYANVTINGNGTGATARAIMSPQGGHGKNAINELCASRILFYTTISNDPNQGFSINNDFSQIGLIRDMRGFESQSLFFGTNASPLYAFTVSGSSFQLNDTFQDASSGAQYKVFALNGNHMLVQNFNNSIPAINNVLNNTSRIGQNTITAITVPTIDKFSGEFLYVGNILASQSSSDQIITVKTTIKF